MYSDKRIFKDRTKGWVCEYTFNIESEAKYLYADISGDYSRGDIDKYGDKVFIEKMDNKIILYSADKRILEKSVKKFEKSVKNMWDK